MSVGTYYDKLDPTLRIQLDQALANPQLRLMVHHELHIIRQRIASINPNRIPEEIGREYQSLRMELVMWQGLMALIAKSAGDTDNEIQSALDVQSVNL